MTDTSKDAFEQFCKACRRGDQQAARELFNSIDNIDAFDRVDTSPLMLAVRSSNVHLVRFLLDSGADVTCSNNDNFTALHEAAHVENNVDVLRLLIERGAHLNASTIHGDLPVEFAGCVANLRCFLDAGLDPEEALAAANWTVVVTSSMSSSIVA